MSAEEHMADVKRYADPVDKNAVAGIVKHLGIALKSKDASIVSCSSKDELARVRDSWLKKKLGLTNDDAALDAMVKAVCDSMKGDKQKHRVTFYYLLAQKAGKLDTLA